MTWTTEELWDTQPLEVVGVNPEFEDGLAVLMSGGSGVILGGTNANAAAVGLAIGLDPASYSTVLPVVVGVEGIGIEVPASGAPAGFVLPRASGALDAKLDIPAGSDYTWLFSVDVSAYGAGNPAIFRSANGTGASFLFLSATQLWVRHSGSDFTVTITGPAVGTTANVCVSVNSSSRVRAWVNGRLCIDSTTATATANLTGGSAVNVIGRNGNSASNERVAGVYKLIGLWHLARNDGDDLTVNPWQVLEPRRIIVPVSAAASTYTIGTPTYVPGSITSTGFRPRIPVTVA